MSALLERLLRRGDIVYIRDGALIIEAASGKPISPDWITQHRDELARAAVTRLCIVGVMYTNYTTGNYGQHKAGGVTLHFNDLATGDGRFVIFNAVLSRARNSKHGKKGAALSKGQFRVGVRSSFNKLWQRAGLPPPRSLSEYHREMKSLKGVIFETVRAGGERLDKQTLQPMNISHRQLLGAFDLLDNAGVDAGQFSGNCWGRNLGKDSSESLAAQGFQPDETTRAKNYGIRLIGDTGKGRDIPPNHIPYAVAPIDQTPEQWIHDFDNAKASSEL